MAAKCRSRVNNPLRFGGPDEIYGPTNVLTSARGNLSARSGRKKGEERRGGEDVGQGGGTFSLANPGDDVLSY